MQASHLLRSGRTPVSPRTGLTLKQEAFALGLANGMNQSGAYRAAYAVRDMSARSIWKEASRLALRPRVARRVEELREEKVRDTRRERAEMERYVLAELHRLAEEAVSERDKLKALELMGRTVAMFELNVRKKSVPPRSPESVMADLTAALAKLGLKHVLEDSHGTR